MISIYDTTIQTIHPHRTLYLNMMQKGGTIIDVRTIHEYAHSHLKGSINIPLEELNDWLEDVKYMDAPIFLCSSKGDRSHEAQEKLLQLGIPAIDLGNWEDYF